MKKLECENCGAALNPRTLKCEYCGTQYEREHGSNVIRIESYPREVDVIQSKITFDKYAVDCAGLDRVMESAMNELERSFLKELRPYIEQEVMYEPRDMTTTVRARLRVIKPGFKF